ncbi:MAG: glycosyltransferase [Sporichthyaceae bacterium]
MARPRLSLVVPMYGVEAYLPEFLDSLDAQSDSLAGVEVVFVDDGSPDRSAQIAADWMAAHPAVPSILLTQQNAGLASARNAGLAAARGEWVSFPDPDDVLTPTYLAVVRAFVESARASKVALAATNLIYLDEETGARRDAHPLRFKFAGSHHRIVDLGRAPDHIHLSAASGWYRHDVIQRLGLHFDERITPTFEDAHLTARYLRDDPRIAMLEDAVYLYRRRSDSSSQVQSGWLRESKYVAVPRHGWLDLLESFTCGGQGIPGWVANLVLYDMIGYFRADLRPDSATHDIPAAWGEAFMDAAAEVVRRLGPEVIADYSVGWCTRDVRRALLFGLGEGPTPSDMYCDRIDVEQALVRVTHYRYRAGEPTVTYTVRGAPAQPVHEKVRAIEFFGRTLAREYTAWLPLGAVRVRVDDRAVPIVVGTPKMPRYSVGVNTLQSQLAPTATAGGRGQTRGAEHAGGSGGNRRTWLLMGTVDAVGADAEALYEALRTAEPATPSHVVLDPNSPQWSRLQASGVPLLAYGSAEHLRAMADCRHLVTSQLDEQFWEVVDAASGADGPPRVIYLPPDEVRRVDHRTLNRRTLDLVIVAGREEYDRIVSEGSPFAYSTKEVALTGRPRHDGAAARRVYDAIRALDLPHDAPRP